MSPVLAFFAFLADNAMLETTNGADQGRSIFSEEDTAMTGATSHTNQVQAMRFKSQAAFSDPSAEVYQLLGGKNLLPVEVRDFIGAHHAIESGLPVHSVFYLSDIMKHPLAFEILSQVVGLSSGTLQRKRNGNSKNTKL
ncbi:MAG: hypothetical protein JXQ85_02245 [Cognatishimia sp.]|uniref:hypothetical protein n=1 Tax=Cognatishimia sp. TaxID=2211648 RepID=UPI003B8AA30A